MDSKRLANRALDEIQAAGYGLAAGRWLSVTELPKSPGKPTKWILCVTKRIEIPCMGATTSGRSIASGITETEIIINLRANLKRPNYREFLRTGEINSLAYTDIIPTS